MHTALNPVGISASENPSVLVQLTGLGGVGKSLLATEYAKRFGAAYPGGIHWLRAYGFDPGKPMDPQARERDRQRQIEDFALGHDVPIRDKTVREVSRDLGRKLAAGGPYLWIVDDLPPDLDQEQGLPGWYAPSSNGRTLITTRAKEYAGIGVTVEVDVLEPEPAFELLTQERKAQTEQEKQDARSLAEALGHHALALDVAGHFLLKTQGFAALRDELAQAHSDPLGELVSGLRGQLPGGHEKSIVATLMQSIRLLGEEGLNLLRLAGELRGGTPVSFRLVQPSFAGAFTLDEGGAAGYLTRAVNQLDTHSLATLARGGAAGDALSIHALVRYTLLHSDRAQEQARRLRETLRKSAVAALVELLADVTDIRQHTRLEPEIAHARHLAGQPRTADEASLSLRVAQFEGERGNYREARAIADQTLPILRRVLGPDHPDTLRTRNNIAAWTGQTGEAREALRLFRELLPDRERVLGADHPATLTTRNNIAHWTGQTGEAREALRLFQLLLPDQVRGLGPDHPATLGTRNNIAVWTGQTGEAREALRLSRELLPDQVRGLGPDHPETLTTRANIAHWTGQTGEAREALRLFRELLPDQVRVLGPDHPDTTTIRKWIIQRLEASNGNQNWLVRALRRLVG